MNDWNEQLYNFLLLLYSCVIEALCLKTIKIEFSFVPIPDRKNLLKAGMNALIQYSTLLVMTLSSSIVGTLLVSHTRGC